MPLGLSLMFMGYLWRKWLLSEEQIPTFHLVGIGILYSLLIPLICVMGYSQTALMSMNTYFLALALFLVFTTILRMHHPALLYLGKVSYSVYLIHCMVGKYVISYIFKLNPYFYIEHQYLIFIPMLVAMIVSLILASLTYYFVEEPFVKLGKKKIKEIMVDKVMIPASAA